MISWQIPPWMGECFAAESTNVLLQFHHHSNAPHKLWISKKTAKCVCFELDQFYHSLKCAKDSPTVLKLRLIAEFLTPSKPSSRVNKYWSSLSNFKAM